MLIPPPVLIPPPPPPPRSAPSLRYCPLPSALASLPLPAPSPRARCGEGLLLRLTPGAVGLAVLPLGGHQLVRPLAHPLHLIRRQQAPHHQVPVALEEGQVCRAHRFCAVCAAVCIAPSRSSPRCPARPHPDGSLYFSPCPPPLSAPRSPGPPGTPAGTPAWIAAAEVTAVVREMAAQANIEVTPDVVRAFERALDLEASPVGRR